LAQLCAASSVSIGDAPLTIITLAIGTLSL
jgi:hypothetical protein